MKKRVLKTKKAMENRISELSENSYDYIPDSLITTDHFTFPNEETEIKFMRFCCKSSFFCEGVDRVFKEYDLLQTFPRRDFEDEDKEKNGIAFLYRSPDGKLRGIKEASYGFDYPSHILAKREYIWADKNIDGTSKDCYSNEISRLEKELMQDIMFNPLPCPFGLHLVAKRPGSVIRVFDNNNSALKGAIYDPDSIYIAADEEQLAGDLAKEAFKGRKVIYYPRRNKVGEAQFMSHDLRKRGVRIAINTLIADVKPLVMFGDHDITDYIECRLKEEWDKSQIFAEIQKYDESAMYF